MIHEVSETELMMRRLPACAFETVRSPLFGAGLPQDRWSEPELRDRLWTVLSRTRSFLRFLNTIPSA